MSWLLVVPLIACALGAFVVLAMLAADRARPAPQSGPQGTATGPATAASRDRAPGPGSQSEETPS
ncbi:MAG: hypothetical protein AAF677_07820 [Pseudomonadota bacterium]